MKAIESFWSSTFKGLIGIVVVEDEHTFERKAYIGIGAGGDEAIDEAAIMQMGSPFPMGTVQRIVRQLRTQKQRRGKVEPPVRC